MQASTSSHWRTLHRPVAASSHLTVNATFAAGDLGSGRRAAMSWRVRTGSRVPRARENA